MFKELHATLAESWRASAAVASVGSRFLRVYPPTGYGGRPAIHYAATSNDVYQADEDRFFLDLRAVLVNVAPAIEDPKDPPAGVFQAFVSWYVRQQEIARLEALAAKKAEEERIMNAAVVLGSVEPFSGEPEGGYGVQAFLQAVSMAADLAKLVEAEKCQLCRLKLRGAAREFLETDPDLPALQSWGELSKRLLQRFAPADDVYTLSTQFHAAKQRSNESVAAFASRLQRLGARWNEARGPTTDADKAVRRAILAEMVLNQFVQGLDSRYRKYVQIQRPADIEQALRFAKAEELDSISNGLRSVALVSSRSPAPSTSAPRAPSFRHLDPGFQGEGPVSVSNARAFTVRMYNPSRLPVTLESGRPLALLRSAECQGSPPPVPASGPRIAAVCAADDDDDVIELGDPSVTPQPDGCDLIASIPFTQLDAAQTAAARALLSAHASLFDQATLAGSPLFEADIVLTKDEIVNVPQFRLPFAQNDFLVEEVKRLERLGIARDSTSPFNSPCFAIRKVTPPGAPQQFRAIWDFRKVNDLVATTAFVPLPRIDACLDALAFNKYFTKMDLQTGFFNMRLTERACKYTAFTVHGMPGNPHKELTRVPLGLRTSSTEHFSVYLLHHPVPFELRTDHAALRSLKSLKDPHSRLFRWSLELSKFSYYVVHCAGRDHHLPDLLSRLTPLPSALPAGDPAPIAAVVTRAQARAAAGAEQRQARLDAALAAPPAPPPPDRPEPVAPGEELAAARQPDGDELPLPPLTPFIWDFAGLRAAQRADAFCSARVAELRDPLRRRPGGFALNGHDLLVLREEGEADRLVIPTCLVSTMIHQAHSIPLSGHYAADSTWRIASRSMFWPNMRRDIERYVARCTTCLRFNHGRVPKAPLVRVSPTPGSWYRVAIDICGPYKPDIDQNTHILTVLCTFSRFLIAVPLKDTKGLTIAQALVTRAFMTLGVPYELLSDNAPNLLRGALEECRDLLGVARVRIHTYMPSENIVERAHGDLARVLRKVISEDQLTWGRWVEIAAFCHNQMINRSTGTSPHWAMFFRQGHFPTEAFLDPPAPYYAFGDDYVADMLHRMRLTYTAMAEAMDRSSAARERAAARTARVRSIRPGDLCFLRVEKVPAHLSPKFAEKWAGPMRVLRLSGKRTVTIQKVLPKNRHDSAPFSVHINKLKLAPRELSASGLPLAPLKRSAPVVRFADDNL
ncbi:hypothetical protein FOCC_FOCC011941 [Frankliniella occidentalis]|nr:hypothetical protein FOCC_FOCC011941 [Frankliniella occidentalis]